MPTRRGNLEAVPPGARAPRRPRPHTVITAAANGTHRDLLIALRTRIATAINDPNASLTALAALSKRLMEIDTEIIKIDTPPPAPAADPIGDAAATPDDAWAPDSP